MIWKFGLYFLVICIQLNVSGSVTVKSLDVHDTDADNVHMTELEISSKALFKFATVDIKGTLHNTAEKDREVRLDVRIPHNAFITSLVINVGDKQIHGIVKEKRKALDDYEEAKTSNSTAAVVTQQTSIHNDRDRDIFYIYLNVVAGAEVGFRIQYQELLTRRAGQYNQKIYINPMQVVSRLHITCEISGHDSLRYVGYKTPINSTKAPLITNIDAFGQRYGKKIEWQPSEFELTSRPASDSSVPFEITYDIESEEEGGEVVYNEFGEFIHFFSAQCNNVMNKKVIFVLDVSGSMEGNPIAQVRTAMQTILDKLRSNDYLNIILFSKAIETWKTSFVPATETNIQRAKTFIINNAIAGGSTNINLALTEAALLIDKDARAENVLGKFGKLIVFLTDGEPTTGVISRSKIRENVRALNFIDGVHCCKTTIISIAVGISADTTFLENIAQENAGHLFFIRDQNQHVITNLVKMFEEVENVVYQNLNFSFRANGHDVPQENLTESFFFQYDCGDEIVVGGWTDAQTVAIEAKVELDTIENRITLSASIPSIPTSNENSKLLSRLVAYQRVKKLLKLASLALTVSEKDNYDKLALSIALEEQFVTPITALVVTGLPSRDMSLPLENRALSGLKLNVPALQLPTTTPVFMSGDVSPEDTIEENYTSKGNTHRWTSIAVYCVVFLLTRAAI